MTDHEMLELAAKAADIKYDSEPSKPREGRAWWGLWLHYDDEPGEYARRYWNPLRDDGDALRLAVKLRFRMSVTLDGVSIDRGPGQALAWERTGVASDEDRCGTAIRRAIVLAAAKIGKNL